MQDKGYSYILASQLKKKVEINMNALVGTLTTI